MKIEIEEIDLHMIKRRDALELRNEINKATGGKIYFNDEYPRLKELYEILGGCFESSHAGVHTAKRNQD